MKYILSVILALGFSTGIASASVCGNNYRAEMVTDPVTLVISTVQVFDHYMGCDTIDPMKVVQAWGLDGYNTPKAKAGETIVDKMGLTDTCPKWYMKSTYGDFACFNLTSTKYYEDKMISTAKQILQNGGTYRGFGGWLAYVR